MCAQVETEGFGKLARAMGYMPAGLPDYFVYQAKPLIKPQVGHWVPCLTCGCHIWWCISCMLQVYPSLLKQSTLQRISATLKQWTPPCSSTAQPAHL